MLLNILVLYVKLIKKEGITLSLLKLEDIGKIYVNEGNVTVGIRGVNLEFNKGEFVAVTGESGSGKSTLLNVISGMDGYEEGEMYIQGEPTSHYIQSDYEEYRNKYISFIFQDYNIIESFSVLENVELALMNIENTKERRQRALDLIKRVGLLPWINHKGSKLSGGQKQRTVIARALAKDSPIILADEPTGNLDSVTSKQIIDLLKEISKDKLLIVVTHNYEELEKHATRHIRIYDGSVYFDKKISEGQVHEEEHDIKKYNSKKIYEGVSYFKKGFTLGKTMFKSKPLLSFFTVILLIVSSLCMLLVTSFCYEPFIDLERSDDMFVYHEGRLIFMQRDGSPLSASKVESIAERFGATEYLYYDLILDKSVYNYYEHLEDTFEFEFAYYNEELPLTVGRYPEGKMEIMLYLPISFKDYYGEDEIKVNTFNLYGYNYTVVGVGYFYDNTRCAKIMPSKEGMSVLSELSSLELNSVTTNVYYTFTDGSVESVNTVLTLDMSLEGKTIVVPEPEDSNDKFIGSSVNIQFYKPTNNYDFMYGYDATRSYVSMDFSGENVKTSKDALCARISPELLGSIVYEHFKKDYSQASLFFDSDIEAQKAADIMNGEEFISVISSTEFEPDLLTVVTTTIVAVFMGILWFLVVMFLSFFISLCLSRTVGSIKNDLAIMRSMGIPVKVIKCGVFVKMFLSMVSAFIPVILVAIFVFTTPSLNAKFSYLSPMNYLLVFFGVGLIDIRVTKKQIKKLFDISVKKSIKGGKDQ